MIRSLLPALLLPVVSYAVESVHLTGREAEAVQRATQIFISKQGTKYAGWPVYGNLRNYTIELRRHGTKLEIDFLPNEVPLKPNEAGTGGGNKNGWEVVYVFSLSPLKLLEEHYTR